MVRQTNDRPIEFLLFRDLPYRKRLLLVALSLFVGILAQYSLCLWLGAVGAIIGGPLVLFAALLSVARGCKLQITPVRTGEWSTVTVEQFTRILDLAEKTKKWARSAFSIAGPQSCVTCVIVLIFLMLFLGGGPLILKLALAYPVVGLVVLDVLIFLIAIWGTGRLSAEYPKDLVLKTETLMNLLNYQRDNPLPDVALEPMLEIGAKKGKSAPSDVRLMAKLKSAPKEFIGVQVQCSLNSVQGTQYPYVYCVILGFKGFKLRESFESLPKGLQDRLKEDICEFKTDKDVEILVVRQHADKSGGWHTKPRDQVRLYTHSLDVARAMAAVRNRSG